MGSISCNLGLLIGCDSMHYNDRAWVATTLWDGTGGVMIIRMATALRLVASMVTWPSSWLSTLVHGVALGGVQVG